MVKIPFKWTKSAFHKSLNFRRREVSHIKSIIKTFREYDNESEVEEKYRRQVALQQLLGKIFLLYFMCNTTSLVDSGPNNQK